ncbi:MAG: glutaredoxin family protein [Deltaproteobacteria bacterium]
MKIKKMILAILIQILALGISSAEIYKWVDENGVTHYSDSPTEITAALDEDEIEEIQTPESAPAETPRLPDETPKNTRNPDSSNNPDETQEDAAAVNSPSVEIYEASWCVYCNKAKNFFRSRGIDFVTYDIEKDKQAAHRMRSLTNLQAVPFVVINGQGISGYSVAAYEQALQN